MIAGRSHAAALRILVVWRSAVIDGSSRRMHVFAAIDCTCNRFKRSECREVLLTCSRIWRELAVGRKRQRSLALQFVSRLCRSQDSALGQDILVRWRNHAAKVALVAAEDRASLRQRDTERQWRRRWLSCTSALNGAVARLSSDVAATQIRCVFVAWRGRTALVGRMHRIIGCVFSPHPQAFPRVAMVELFLCWRRLCSLRREDEVVLARVLCAWISWTARTARSRPEVGAAAGMDGHEHSLRTDASKRPNASSGGPTMAPQLVAGVKKALRHAAQVILSEQKIGCVRMALYAWANAKTTRQAARLRRELDQYRRAARKGAAVGLASVTGSFQDARSSCTSTKTISPRTWSDETWFLARHSQEDSVQNFYIATPRSSGSDAFSAALALNAALHESGHYSDISAGAVVAMQRRSLPPMPNQPQLGTVRDRVISWRGLLLAVIGLHAWRGVSSWICISPLGHAEPASARNCRVDDHSDANLLADSLQTGPRRWGLQGHSPTQAVSRSTQEQQHRTRRLAAYEPGEVPTRSYRALTKIMVRVDPDIASEKLAVKEAARVRKGEILGEVKEDQVFEVCEELEYRGQVYLKLARQPGWVFTRGVAGSWAGREIVALAPKRPGRIMNPFEFLKREFLGDGYDEEGFYSQDAGGKRPMR